MIAPNYFRSRLTVHIGEPIELAAFQKMHQKDRFQATKSLTNLLAERLSMLLVNTQNAAEDKLVHQLETIYANEQPLSSKKTYFRTLAIVEKVHELEAKKNTPLIHLKKQIAAYFDKLKDLNINDLAVVQAQKGQSLLGHFLFLLLGWPFFLYGFINNALAAFISVALTRMLNLYIGYSSTIKILGGLVFFGVFYSILIYLFQQWLSNGYLTFLYALSLIPSGILAWKYHKLWQQTWQTWRAKRLKQKIKDLWTMRKGLFILDLPN